MKGDLKEVATLFIFTGDSSVHQKVVVWIIKKIRIDTETHKYQTQKKTIFWKEPRTIQDLLA